MTKKEALTLGLLAIGGIGFASMLSGGEDSGGVGARAGGILGSPQATPAGATIYNLPAEGAVTFPEPPVFDISKIFPERLAQPPESRGAAGVSAAPKKSRPYLYTGGEVKAGAVSVAPWAMGVSTPAEIGITTALKIPTGGMRLSGTPSKKTSSDAQKAISHAKRLRAGRGD